MKHEEFPKEEAAVETFGALKQQYGDRHLAIRRSGQPKKWTQGNGGYWKKWAAAQGQLTHCVIPAQRNRHCCQEEGKDKAMPRTQKGWKFGKRCRAEPKGSNGIREQDLREQ
jgi:hypothetical protein